MKTYILNTILSDLENKNENDDKDNLINNNKIELREFY